MSKEFDPVTWIAAVCLVAAGGLGVWWVLDEESSAAVAPGLPSSDGAPPHNGGPAAGGGSAGGGGPAPAAPDLAGWVPATAQEAVDTAAAARDQPPSGPACEDRANLVDLAKNTAVLFEAELRKATALADAEEASLGDRIEREASRAAPFAGKWDLDADRQRYGKYLQGLVDHLAKGAKRPGLRFRVHVVRDSAFNAFAMAGGVLAVHTAVLEGELAVRDEAELAAVLGHEIAHVERRHAAAAYQYARAVLGPDADEAAVIAQALKVPISTEYEHEADARGLELAAQAQYDAFAASRLWARHGERQGPDSGHRAGGVLGTVIGAAEQVLHSHPPAAQRCARTRASAAELAKSAQVQRWYRGVSNVRERVTGPDHPY
jgi:predicted Zn-dependent protease